MDRKLKQFPEVMSVFGKMGRASTPTDPAPIGMVETAVMLKPREHGGQGMTWDDLIAEMDRALRYPGMPNIWWMPIQTRTEMLSTGIRSPLGIKVFGDDLATIEDTAVAHREGGCARSPARAAPSPSAPPAASISTSNVDRDAAARYGLRVADVNDVVQTAIGGMTCPRPSRGASATRSASRYARDFRDDPTALERVLVATPGGAQVPLSAGGRHRVRHRAADDPQRGRPLVGFVFVDTGDRRDRRLRRRRPRRWSRARCACRRACGSTWAGQFQYFERAKERLKVVVPVTLVLDLPAALPQHGSADRDGIVLLAVPFSLIGAVWLLYLLGYNMSVAVWVGLIALAGLDAETGVVMLLYLKLAHGAPRDEGRMRSPADLREAIVEGAARAHPPEADDRAHHLHRPAAGDVEHRHRRRRHEAHRRAHGRRPGDLVPARADRLSGDLRAVEGSRHGAGVVTASAPCRP